MGFPTFVVPGRGEDPAAFPENQGIHQKTIQQQCAVSNMLQALAQLTDVRAYAAELFTNLSIETDKTLQRISSVRKRINNLSEQVPSIENTFRTNAPACFYPSNAYTDKSFAMSSFPRGGVFAAASRPDTIRRRRDQATPVPDLDKLNAYKPCLDVKQEFNLHCSDLYSNPRFFYDTWLSAEQEKERIAKEKKARRKKRKKPKKRRSQHPREIVGINKTFYTSSGEKIVKQVGPGQAVGERVTQFRGKVVKEEILYDNRNHNNQESSNNSPQVNLYQPKAYQPKMPPTQQQQRQMGAAPPQLGSMNSTPAQPAHTQMAPPVHTQAVPRQAQVAQPAPQHHQTQMQPGGPPVVPVQSYAPPQQQAAVAPPKPAAPVMPEILKKYSKMQKIGLREAQIKNKMLADKVDQELYHLWLDPSGPKGVGVAAPAASTTAGPPPAGLDLSGAHLKKASAAPARRAPVDIFAQLRAGISLKKAAPIEKVVDKRDDMLSLLRKGINLKKSTDRKLKEPAPAKAEPNSIFSILGRRKMIAVDDDESEDDSWETDS